MRLDRLRPGQAQAHSVSVDRIASRQAKTAIICPTRYGKSDIIRLVSVTTCEQSLACGHIALSPSTFLRDQLVREDNLRKMAERYELGPFVVSKMRKMESATEFRPFSNGEYLLSATMQLATRNIDRICELIENQIRRTSLPVVIHIDECHETSEQKKRGELVERLGVSGALISLYTATAIRADGEIIPGFDVKEVERENVKRYVATDAGDGEHNRVDIYEGERRVVELTAHHTTTFKQAWNEDPSPLCNLSREVIEVNLRDLTIAESSDDVLLSSCSPHKARKYLSKAVRHPLVIEKGVELFVHELNIRKQANPNVAGIIFSCNDSDGERNRHASEIASAISVLRPDYRVAIITMKAEEGDEEACRQIERFVGVNNRAGIGDVLIVKQMCGAGLDAPRIKVLLDLSPVRTVASVIQRLMRVATPWGKIKTGSVVTLADPLMDAIWKKCVTNEGGEKPRAGESDLELVKSYLVPKRDCDTDQNLMDVVSAEIHAFDDNLGQIGDVQSLDVVNELMSRFPSLSDLHTKAELSDKLSGFSIQPQVKPVTTGSLSASISAKRKKINRLRKKRAQAEWPYKAFPRQHADALRRWMNNAKAAAGLPTTIELSDVVCAESLDAMIKYLEQQLPMEVAR